MSYPRPDQFDRDFDKTFRRAGKAFGAWFVFCALLGLGLLAIVVWALIRVVLHFT